MEDIKRRFMDTVAARLAAAPQSAEKEELVEEIATLEFEAFDKVKNEGGRASCQNDWGTFSIMRKSQYSGMFGDYSSYSAEYDELNEDVEGEDEE